MSEPICFPTRTDFRNWLEDNCESTEGVWLLFGKAGGPETLKAGEALEEALCFGWIDGQMQSIDETVYRKYFAQRRANSKWSEKNKTLVGKLEERGIMTDRGRATTEDQIEQVAAILEGHVPAYSNFLAMSPSVKKTYTRAYFDAKTEAGREKRLAWMIERLDKNLKPM